VTDRSIPLLSLAVPSSMPQTCPNAPLDHETFASHAGFSDVDVSTRAYSTGDDSVLRQGDFDVARDG
jgi:hypothetical protein